MTEYPISAHYREHIVDCETISKRGVWWTAVLLIKDPKSGKPFIGLYRWQSTKDGWKMRKRFTFRRKEEVENIFRCVEKFAQKLSEFPSEPLTETPEIPHDDSDPS
ncbi:MAG: hypothetical protein PHE58_02105 [Candidatus Omnitrophica bacterium]|nr:hypothetical protein [Candidatus Omnitrophota bacterium]